MLTIRVVTEESYDEQTEEFVDASSINLSFEHSLVSMSKWESKFKKPLLGDTPKTSEETLWYVRCMVLTPDISPEIFDRFTKENYDAIDEYINDSMTATWFSEEESRSRNREIITSELIYYWMIALGIPSEYQYWHLERLLTLVRICNLKNKPAKKMGRHEAIARQRELNAQRKAQHNTRG